MSDSNSMTDDEAAELAQQLTEDAYAALENGEGARVAEICAELRVMHYSSCFEIEALLALDQNQPARALEVLDEGVEAVPDLWSLWQLKGNILSDGGQFEAALEAYERAGEIEDADQGALCLNRATAMWREGRAKAALREIEAHEFANAALDLQWRRDALQLNLWAQLKRCDEVKQRAAQLFAQQEDLELEPDEAAQVSVAFSQIGWALKGCDELENARDWADAALEIDRTNGQALLLRREATPDLPLADKTFRVMLSGEIEDESDGEIKGFYTPLLAVAADADGAQKLALEFESAYHQTPITVEEIERIGVCERQPICVYQVDAYFLFPLDEN